MKLGIMLFMLACFVGGCSYVNRLLHLPDDNPVEELIEEQINEALNVDIDLTPESAE